ncbi:MAG: bifunctional oligoribonuclease/PAP phosphatase NrnA [Tenuifilaceae bacterium]|jgi:phosphoesterase RecJ-like protein|nr:bifunctional oligoribonuclease/PAP phosphatase NrnA [Tenuifilaceae bacterium]
MSIISPLQAEEIKAFLHQNQNIVITSHHNPDGDAIGSILGLYHILRGMGVPSTMIIPNDIPEFLNWLPGAAQILRYSKNPNEAKEHIKNAQVLFALDYNGSARLEKMEKHFAESQAVKVLIDHHPNPEKGFNYYFSQTAASSTAELVYEFAHAIGAQSFINTHCAINLFAGIMTDTGSFSYACSSPRTFEIVARLVSLGVKVEEVQQKVYNNFSEDRMRLMGHSLATKMRVFHEFKAAYISLTRDELKRFNYRIGDTEGLVNLPLSIKGIIFSALLVENTDFVKVSLRSSGNFPVNKICEEFFNGGGHQNAAGGKSFATITETENKFIEVLNTYKDMLNP